MPLSSLRTLVALALAASSAWWPLTSAYAQAPISGACAAAGETMTRAAGLQIGGVTRSYLIHVDAYARDERLPLVFAFHGRGETPESIEAYAGLDRLHAVVVYPRGVAGRGGKLSWGGMPTAAAGADDIAFTRALVDRLKAESCIDAARVYATGKSDGGGFAAILACTASEIVSKIAPVAGAYYPVAGGCLPSRPVAILAFHGTGDRVIPYEGDVKRQLPDIDRWLAAWAQRDGCSRDDGSRSVTASVSVHGWTHCSGEVTVTGYRIDGGGHTWPDAAAPSGPGPTSHDIDATAQIAAFFGILRHPSP